MPFFRYIASDATGRTLEGTLQAASGQEATQLLARQGLTVSQLSGSGTAVAAAVQKPSVPAPRAAIATATRPAPQSAAIPAVPQKKQLDVVRTKRGNDKHLFFLFTQLAGYFRAGMNPRLAFQDMAVKAPHLYYQSMMDIAQGAGEGLKISDGLARYPDLYPAHVVGMVRAGEMAGFLPEAFQEVADWAHPSYRLKRILSAFNTIAVITILTTPLGLALVNGSLASWDVQEASGGTTPAVPLLTKLVGVAFLPLVLPTVLALVAYYIGRYYWRGDKNQLNRHRLILMVPVLGRRARSESLRQFAYALGLTSRAGVAPHTAFKLSADAMANLDLAQKLRDSAEKGDDSTKLTTLLSSSNVVPHEYQNVIDTGEVTGDIPGAALHVADASNVEFQAAEGNTKYVKSAIVLFIVLISVVIFGIIYKTFLMGMFTHILGTD